MFKFNSINTYVWGCQHKNHINILRYANRPFKSIDEMNRALWLGLENLPDGSILIDLGDFSFGGNRVVSDNWTKYKEILIKKNIKCYFIFGNHDRYIRKNLAHSNDCAYSDDPFYFCDILEFTLLNVSDFIVASHYPMEDWHGKSAHHSDTITPTGGSYHIHCHTHRELENSHSIRRIHGGVDTIGFQPILVTKLLERIK